MTVVDSVLLAVSAAPPELLAYCPSERGRLQSLGLGILMTDSLAAVSMWFALTSAMGFNPVLSRPVSVVWGLIIMGIDRISTPIVLRIFESEINNQVSVIKESNEVSFLTSQQDSSLPARVTKWQRSGALSAKALNMAEPGGAWNTPAALGSTGSSE